MDLMLASGWTDNDSSSHFILEDNWISILFSFRNKVSIYALFWEVRSTVGRPLLKINFVTYADV